MNGLYADMICVPLARSMMAERKAFNMRTFSIWHNTAMALLSLWMVIETLTSVRFQPPYCAASMSHLLHLNGSLVHSLHVAVCMTSVRVLRPVPYSVMLLSIIERDACSKFVHKAELSVLAAAIPVCRMGQEIDYLGNSGPVRTDFQPCMLATGRSHLCALPVQGRNPKPLAVPARSWTDAFGWINKYINAVRRN